MLIYGQLWQIMKFLVKIILEISGIAASAASTCVWTAIPAIAVVLLPLLCGHQQLLLQQCCSHSCVDSNSCYCCSAAPTPVWKATAATAAVLLPQLCGQQ